jgi:polyphenol oxidase
MIKSDQFTNLPPELTVLFSSRDDGTVLDRALDNAHAPALITSRQAICEQAGIDYQNTVYQKVVYSDTSSYDRLVEVGVKDTTRYRSEVVADALVTKKVGIGLFLPVADCIVTVLYDPHQKILCQAHMGRHSTLSGLLSRVVEYFVANGSRLRDINVWMEPSVTKKSYRLEYFDHADSTDWQGFVERRDGAYYIDMQGFNRQRLIQLGVRPENITVSDIDTFENRSYFSHFRGDIHGRQAGLAMMR